MLDPVYEIVGDPRAGALLFTCEHATRRLPEWEPEPEDRPVLEDHWGWDVGAADLARALARRLGCAAVLSRFSRLVCDPNRRPEEPSFVVERAGGRALSFNRGIDAAERERRRARYFEPYHAAIDRVLAARRERGDAPRLVSIHSFTPVFDGAARALEVGVLYDDHREHADRLAAALAREGFATAHNEPYSGYAGLIYAAARHGRAHGIPYLELEVRSDRIDTPKGVRRVAAGVARALESFRPGLPAQGV